MQANNFIYFHNLTIFFRVTTTNVNFSEKKEDTCKISHLISYAYIKLKITKNMQFMKLLTKKLKIINILYSYNNVLQDIFTFLIKLVVFELTFGILNQ